MNTVYRLLRLAVLFTIGMLVGCTVTETGNPSVIDTDSIYLQKADSGVRMVGEEKAVVPGGSQLRIVNLDDFSEPTDITVNKDGSFDVLLDGSVENVFRLRALYRGHRSEPVNVSGVPVEEPNCITAEPPSSLDLPDTKPQESSKGEIVLTNHCDESVRLIEQTTRLRSNAIEMESLDLPLTIEPGESLSVDVSFAPTAAGEYEGIAVLVFESRGRIAVDLFGRAPGENNTQTIRLEAAAGVCSGANTNCDIDVEPIVSGYVPAKTAAIEQLDRIDIEWMNVIEQADCPLPPCYLFSPQLAEAPDGSVSIAAKVTMGDTGGTFPAESGFWFARYTAEGNLLKQDFINFAIPSPSAYMEYTPSLAVDSQGTTFLAVLSQLHPDDQVAEDGELSVYKYRSDGELQGVPITRYGVRYARMYMLAHASSIFVDPEDNLILVSHYRNREAPDPPESEDPAMHEEYPPATRVDITKYNRNGNLIWNQSGLNQGATSTTIGELSFDAAGNMIVPVYQIYADEQAPRWTIARLDRDGNVVWTRVLANPQSGSIGQVHVVVSGDGNISVVNLLMSEFGDVTNVFIDNFDATGGATWSWELSPDDIDIPALGDYGSSLNIIGRADGTSIIALGGVYESPLLYSFSPDGSRYSVSTIDQLECSLWVSSNPKKDSPYCFNLMLYTSTSSNTYFTAGGLVFGKLGKKVN